jgi:hypothetical protein
LALSAAKRPMSWTASVRTPFPGDPSFNWQNPVPPAKIAGELNKRATGATGATGAPGKGCLLDLAPCGAVSQSWSCLEFAYGVRSTTTGSLWFFCWLLQPWLVDMAAACFFLPSTIPSTNSALFMDVCRRFLAWKGQCKKRNGLPRLQVQMQGEVDGGGRRPPFIRRIRIHTSRFTLHPSGIRHGNSQ